MSMSRQEILANERKNSQLIIQQLNEESSLFDHPVMGQKISINPKSQNTGRSQRICQKKSSNLCPSQPGGASIDSQQYIPDQGVAVSGLPDCNMGPGQAIINDEIYASAPQMDCMKQAKIAVKGNAGAATLVPAIQSMQISQMKLISQNQSVRNQELNQINIQQKSREKLNSSKRREIKVPLNDSKQQSFNVKMLNQDIEMSMTPRLALGDGQNKNMTGERTETPAPRQQPMNVAITNYSDKFFRESQPQSQTIQTMVSNVTNLISNGVSEQIISPQTIKKDIPPQYKLDNYQSTKLINTMLQQKGFAVNKHYNPRGMSFGGGIGIASGNMSFRQMQRNLNRRMMSSSQKNIQGYRMRNTNNYQTGKTIQSAAHVNSNCKQSLISARDGRNRFKGQIQAQFQSSTYFPKGQVVQQPEPVIISHEQSMKYHQIGLKIDHSRPFSGGSLQQPATAEMGCSRGEMGELDSEIRQSFQSSTAKTKNRAVNMAKLNNLGFNQDSGNPIHLNKCFKETIQETVRTENVSDDHDIKSQSHLNTGFQSTQNVLSLPFKDQNSIATGFNQIDAQNFQSFTSEYRFPQSKESTGNLPSKRHRNRINNDMFHTGYKDKGSAVFSKVMLSKQLSNNNSFNKNPIPEQQKKLQDYRAQKLSKQDQDPFGIEKEDSDSIMKRKKTRAQSVAKKPVDFKDKKKQQRKPQADKTVESKKGKKDVKEQTETPAIIDYPRHIRLGSNVQTLQDARVTMRYQKFFHKKFDPELSNYANRHIYKGVYNPNQRLNVNIERNQSVNEYIRKNCPRNMAAEPPLITHQRSESRNKQNDYKHKSGTKRSTLTKAQKLHYKRMRNLPIQLVKSLAHKNNRIDNKEKKGEIGSNQQSLHELEEVPLKISQEGQLAIADMLDKKREEVLDKVRKCFVSQKRMIESQIDDGLEMFVEEYPQSGGKVYEEALQMIKDSEQRFLKQEVQEKMSFFQKKQAQTSKMNADIQNQPQKATFQCDLQPIEKLLFKGGDFTAKTPIKYNRNRVYSMNVNRNRKESEHMIQSQTGSIRESKKLQPVSSKVFFGQVNIGASMDRAVSRQKSKQELKISKLGSEQNKKLDHHFQSIQETDGYPTPKKNFDITLSNRKTSMPNFEAGNNSTTSALPVLEEHAHEGIIVLQGSANEEDIRSELNREGNDIKSQMMVIDENVKESLPDTTFNVSKPPSQQTDQMKIVNAKNKVEKPQKTQKLRQAQAQLAISSIIKGGNNRKDSSGQQVSLRRDPSSDIKTPHHSIGKKSDIKTHKSNNPTLNSFENFKLQLFAPHIDWKTRKEMELRAQKQEKEMKARAERQKVKEKYRNIKKQLEMRKLKHKLKEEGFEDVIDAIMFDQNYKVVSKVKDDTSDKKECNYDEDTIELKTIKESINNIKANKRRKSQQMKINTQLMELQNQEPLIKDMKDLQRKGPVTTKNADNGKSNKIGDGLLNKGKVNTLMDQAGGLKEVEMSAKKNLKSNESLSGEESVTSFHKKMMEKEARDKMVALRNKQPIIDFTHENPDVERKINQFIQKLCKTKTGPKSINTSQYQQEVADLNRILRQCFSEKEFVHENLRSKIDFNVSHIQNYNQQYMHAVNQLQENLEFLVDPEQFSKYQSADDNTQFDAKKIMCNQIYNDQQNYENFMRVGGKDDIKKEMQNSTMKIIMGAGKRSKVWKPSKIEISKHLRQVFNA